MIVTFKVAVSPFGLLPPLTCTAILASGVCFLQFQSGAKQRGLESQNHLHPGTKTKLLMQKHHYLSKQQRRIVSFGFSFSRWGSVPVVWPVTPTNYSIQLCSGCPGGWSQSAWEGWEKAPGWRALVCNVSVCIRAGVTVTLHNYKDASVGGTERAHFDVRRSHQDIWNILTVFLELYLRKRLLYSQKGWTEMSSMQAYFAAYSSHSLWCGQSQIGLLIICACITGK